MTARLLALLLLVPVFAGCISIGDSEPVDPRAYDLLPATAPAAPVVAEGYREIQISPFTVDAALDRDELVWRRGAVETGAWEHHRWARPPHEAVREVLAEGFRAAGIAAVVATEPVLADPDVLVRGHLSRCGERDGPDRWYGVLELRLVVRDVRQGGREILRRTYAREEEAAARNPLAVVEALHRALAGVVADAAADVRAALDRSAFGVPATD